MPKLTIEFECGFKDCGNVGAYKQTGLIGGLIENPVGLDGIPMGWSKVSRKIRETDLWTEMVLVCDKHKIYIDDEAAIEMGKKTTSDRTLAGSIESWIDERLRTRS